MREYIVLKGIASGPTSVIMAGVHGNETCGIQAIECLLPSLQDLQDQILKGRVIFLLGNPLAVQEKKRFIDVNLNRMFLSKLFSSDKIQDSYEYHRAKFLMSVLSNADALLDIHSTRNKSEPFILSDHPHIFDMINQFPIQFKKVVSGIDDLHPGSSDGFMNSIGKIGICIECGQHEDKDAIRNAKIAIYQFLYNMGNLNLPTNEVEKVERTSVHLKGIYKTKTNSFILSQVFNDFDPIKTDQIIATDGDNEVYVDEDGIILFAVNREKEGEEGFMFGKIV